MQYETKHVYAQNLIFIHPKIQFMKNFILHFICLFVLSLQLIAQGPTSIFHERSLADVGDCKYYSGGNQCSLNSVAGEDIPFLNILAPDVNEDFVVGFRIGKTNESDFAKVYYTIDGSNPEVKEGTGTRDPQPGTFQSLATYCCEYEISSGPEVLGDIARATIPGQAGGVTINYIVAAYNNSITYVTDDPALCKTYTCAKVFSYTFPAAAPVELSQFTANPQKEAILLEWSTSAEINNSHFEIERSVNSKDWEVIGTVEGQGNSQILNSYELLDEKANKGINYYRLVQVDFDGATEYSKVVSVLMEAGNPISIYPNPATDNQLQIQTSQSGLQNITVEIIDISGRRQVMSILDLSARSTALPINELSKGIYIVKFYDSNSYLLGSEKLIRF